MTRPLLLTVAAVALLSACAPPDPLNPPTTSVAAGVSVGSDGVQPSGAIVRTNGNFTVGFGFGL